jgi:general secretion pathway protein N
MEMKPARAFSLLTAVALLGVIARIIGTSPPAWASFFAVIETAQSPPRITAATHRGETKMMARTAPQAPPGAADKSDSGIAPPPGIALGIADVRLAAGPGNPLWAPPLERLSITRARPLFSLSRRPPPAYIAPVTEQEAVKPLHEPERPAMLLLGTVIGDSDKLGVFLENSTQKVVHLRVGDDHQGWVLQLVEARRATLVKAGEQVAVLELPTPSGQIVAPPAPVLATGTIPIFSNETSADEQPVRPTRGAQRR